MPFGLSNAPFAFQYLINKIFADILDIYVVIYLDDILIYSDNPTEHINHVKEVLHHLYSHRLFVSSTKYVFYQVQVEFLDFVLGPEGLQINKDKVWVVQNWPRPHYLKDMQAFLGFANFYKCFIHKYLETMFSLI